MAYREDEDLKFLKEMESKDLNDLVFCLTKDKDGNVRLTEELTGSESYKEYYPDHKKYWELIAAELQCFGGNTFVNIFRGGKGVLYKEILIDVCDKLKVNYNKKSDTSRIEELLISKVLTDSLEKMDSEELKKLAIEFGIKHTDGITPQILISSFQTIFQAGGFKSYQLTVIIVNTIVKAILGRGLTFAANATLTRAMSILTGPIGWIITGLWTAIDIAGTAYRVTIPSVFIIIALRRQYLNKFTLEESKEESDTLKKSIEMLLDVGMTKEKIAEKLNLTIEKIEELIK